MASDILRFGDDIEDLMSDESYQRSTAKTTTGSSLMHLMYEPVQSW